MDVHREPFVLLKELEQLALNPSRQLSFDRKVRVLVPLKL